MDEEHAVGGCPVEPAGTFDLIDAGFGSAVVGGPHRKAVAAVSGAEEEEVFGPPVGVTPLSAIGGDVLPFNGAVVGIVDVRCEKDFTLADDWALIFATVIAFINAF